MTHFSEPALLRAQLTAKDRLVGDLAEMLQRVLHLPPPEPRRLCDGYGVKYVQPEESRQVRDAAKRLLERVVQSN